MNLVLNQMDHSNVLILKVTGVLMYI